MPEVKFIRTVHNQLIIGKVLEFQTTIFVEMPYSIMPTQSGLDFQPLDKEMVGVEIEKITLYKESLLYFVEPSQEIKNAYLSAISGIEVEPKNPLIL